MPSGLLSLIGILVFDDARTRKRRVPKRYRSARSPLAQKKAPRSGEHRGAAATQRGTRRSAAGSILTPDKLMLGFK